MKRLTLLVIAMVCMLATGALADVPEKAVCAVCAVKGETEAEKVNARATYEGKVYYFCADDCKEEFEADPVAYIPPVFPRPAPAFVVETLGGSDVALADFKGQLVLIDFWATWCKPCVKIMPEVQALYDRYRERGFTVAGISIDEGDDRIKKIEKFVDKYDITYPVYSDAKAAPAWFEYRVKAVPAMFLVDRNGDVVAQWLGIVDHEVVAAEVARLVGPADAR